MSMWLIPATVATSKVASACSWLMFHNAAAPKINRLLSWPVRPNGAYFIPTPYSVAAPGEKASSVAARCPDIL